MDTKPKRPLTGYFQFQQDHKDEVAALSIPERAKYFSEKWAAVSEADKKQYNETSKKLTDTYKVDLEEFYKKHPEEKLKDEQEAASKKEKKLQGKEPAGLKADEKNIKIFFFVAYIKKYRDQNKPDFLPPTNNAKKMLLQSYKKIEESGDLSSWGSKWTALKIDERQHIKAFYEQWAKLPTK
ncbi:HMG_(High mobility group) box domain-containing protein [Hexamita inflata]|uniref:HMG (High mobility group) box domain-containing protein n=1 Tax=Hexamita inflata TaxID=28002 RepID=A0AA86RGY2_9EUKA|nr:HMG (High mobility group) box domain-containing protein [Hexamita inflata]CAI9977806.1 HMG (High mobility group) box domain-containing protein [Hexamita inflata]